MNNAKKSLVPHRRFKEFQNAGAWEQRKLGDVVERFDNLRIPVTSSKRKRGITPYYGANGIQDYVQGYTHDGEFVLVAEDGANDLQNYPIHYVNGKVWVNNHAHVLQGKKDIADNLFLVNAIKRIKFETYLVGGSRAKLNADVMMKLPIKMPKLNEQQKLGKYFSRIDTLIALHQRKLNKLKKLKSAYLTEMFPDEGEHKPKRRFAGFTDDWEQRKFMDLIDSIIDFRGRTPKKLGMNWSNEGLLALSAQNVKDGYIDKTIDAHYGSQTLYDKWMNGRELHKGQVVFTTEAPMGNVARIPDENKYILSQRTIAFTVKNTVLTEGFLMYLLESPSVKNNLLRISSGGTAKGVSQKTLSSLTVKIPTSLKEQERINFVFYSLDSLITLHQRELKCIVNTFILTNT